MNSAILVPVDLAGRSYTIHIGRDLLRGAGGLLASLAPGAGCIIVTDQHVARHHLGALEAALDTAGIRHFSLILQPGEATKSFDRLQDVTDAILSGRLERGDVVIAFGGGVIGDLAGFAAAIVRRGMRFVQIPTTLLAQVDSSVGGKTAVNTRQGKNLIGAFHQPMLVLADTALLDTLGPREFRAGYAEMVKVGLLGDHAFFEWLEAGAWREVFDGGPARERAVEIACRAKAGIVARDETEQAERALLNLGHTFGHALEAVTGYDSARLVHGEAISIGMAMAFRFSHRLGLCPGQDVVRVERHLVAVGLPTEIAAIPGSAESPARLLEAIRQDKKVSRGALTFILATGIGAAFIARNIAPEDVSAFLAEEMAKTAAAK
jgi:3-dehydroquinate synthase